MIGMERTVVVRDMEIRKLFLAETLDRAGQLFGRDALLVYGPDPVTWQVLEMGTDFRNVFVLNAEEHPQLPKNHIVSLNSWDDWRNLDMRFNVVLCAENPIETDVEALLYALAPAGKVISISSLPNSALLESAGRRLIKLELNLAYSGIVARNLAIERILNAS
jgi:hypothetical protein